MLDPSLLVDYSWADIAKAAKAAMVSAAMGGSTLRMNGREIGRITPDEARKLYEFAIQQLTNDQSPGDGGIILAELR